MLKGEKRKLHDQYVIINSGGNKSVKFNQNTHIWSIDFMS